MQKHIYRKRDQKKFTEQISYDLNLNKSRAAGRALGEKRLTLVAAYWTNIIRFRRALKLCLKIIAALFAFLRIKLVERSATGALPPEHGFYAHAAFRAALHVKRDGLAAVRAFLLLPTRPLAAFQYVANNIKNPHKNTIMTE